MGLYGHSLMSYNNDEKDASNIVESTLPIDVLYEEVNNSIIEACVCLESNNIKDKIKILFDNFKQWITKVFKTIRDKIRELISKQKKSTIIGVFKKELNIHGDFDINKVIVDFDIKRINDTSEEGKKFGIYRLVIDENRISKEKEKSTEYVDNLWSDICDLKKEKTEAVKDFIDKNIEIVKLMDEKEDKGYSKERFDNFVKKQESTLNKYLGEFDVMERVINRKIDELVKEFSDKTDLNKINNILDPDSGIPYANKEYLFKLTAFNINNLKKVVEKIHKLTELLLAVNRTEILKSIKI